MTPGYLSSGNWPDWTDWQKNNAKARALAKLYKDEARILWPVCPRLSSLRKPKEIGYKLLIISFVGGRWSGIGCYLKRTGTEVTRDAGGIIDWGLPFSFACSAIQAGHSGQARTRRKIC